MCVPVCVIRYFSDLCHNACKSIKCEPHRARQCSLICNGITNTLQFHLWRFTHKHTDRLTDWQTDSASDKQPSGWRWHCRGRGWGGRAYQSQINEMWVPQLLPAPTVGCQLDAFCFCQLQLSLASLTRFFLLLSWFLFRLFALLVQTKQISLTLACLACKCHFSVKITQFITFHLTWLESNSQRDQQSILFAPNSTCTQPQPYPNPGSRCECVSNSGLFSFIFFLHKIASRSF